MLKSVNSIDVRFNRFKKKCRFQSFAINNFDFNRGLVSVDSPKLFFINKAFSEDEDVYNMVVNMYLRYLDNDYSFLNDFLTDEIIPDYKADRLLEILKIAQKIKYTNKDLTTIFKMNNREDARLHFFIKVSRNNFSLLLIDLYHMGIYGDNIVNGKVRKIPMQKIYKRYKKNTCKLETIKELS